MITNMKNIFVCMYNHSKFYLKRCSSFIIKKLFHPSIDIMKLILFGFLSVLYLIHKIFYEPVSKVGLPVIVWANNFSHTDYEIISCSNVKCIITNAPPPDAEVSAYLFYGSSIDFNKLPLPRKPFEILWGLYHEESPRNNEIILNDNILRLFNVSSTYSRYSDMPLTLQYLDNVDSLTDLKYYVNTSVKNVLLNDLAPVLYIQTDCDTSTQRDEYTKELMKHIKVDSYGACLNNKRLPKQYRDNYLNRLNDVDFLHFIARYKFTIAIENAVCEDYISEKLWRSLAVGSVPIYFGSPSVKDWLPNENSAILINDFSSPKALAEFLVELLNNDTWFDAYLNHKIKRSVTNVNLVKEFHKYPWVSDPLSVIRNFECTVCKRLFDLKNGNSEIHILNKSHLNCPKPTSAVTKAANSDNPWFYSYKRSMEEAEKIYKSVVESNLVRFHLSP